MSHRSPSRTHRQACAAAGLGLLAIPLLFAPGIAVESTPNQPASKLVKPSKAQRVADRAKQRRLVWQDEHGNIPHDALMTAKAQMQTVLSLGTAAGVDSARWTEAGPGNIGGRIRSILVHPTNHNTIFVGSVSGGLWRSTDAGGTWRRIDDKMGNLAISGIVMDPTNSNLMYVGTGEGGALGGGRQGAGVFQSTNGGTSWTRMASTAGRDFVHINRITMSPDGRWLMVATDEGIFRLEHKRANATWARAWDSQGDPVYDVRFHPTNANIAAAATQLFDFNTNMLTTTGLYSTDGGATWRESNGLSSNGNSRIELRWHAGYTGTGNGCIYAQRDSNNGTLFRSIDGGATYTQVSTNTRVLERQGNYDNILWVDPSDNDANVNDDVIVAGGVDLWRSTDGGRTFTQISQWFDPSSVHADQHAIVAHPAFNGTTNRTVYFGHDGGISRCDNVYTVSNTNGWVKLNGTTLAITQFYGASRHAGTDTLYGGTQDNGTLQTTPRKGFSGWTEPFGGDGGFSASDPTDSRYHYGEYVYAQVHRSSNGGGFAEYIWGEGLQAPYVIGDAGNPDHSLFIAPFILDPRNSNRMLVGGRSLWRSNDVKAPVTQTTGPRWTAIKPWTSQQPELISAIAVDPQSSDRIWVGHDGGHVYYTTNGTAASPTWQRIDTATSPLPDRYITRIVVDPKDSTHVYVLFGGFTANNIWETKNSGTTWAALSNFPRLPVRDLEIHPNRSNWLYAGTEVGLVVSEDAGRTWTSTASPSDVPVDEMFWSSGRLYLATHGRGIFWQEPGAVATSTPVGVPCRIGGPATGARLVTTAPVLGRTMRFDVTNAPAPSVGIQFLSPQSPPLQVSPGCFLRLNLAVMLNVGAMPITNGTGTLQLPLPNIADLAGQKFSTQTVFLRDPEVHLSNGVDLTFGY